MLRTQLVASKVAWGLPKCNSCKPVLVSSLSTVYWTVSNMVFGGVMMGTFEQHFPQQFCLPANPCCTQSKVSTPLHSCYKQLEGSVLLFFLSFSAMENFYHNKGIHHNICIFATNISLLTEGSAHWEVAVSNWKCMSYCPLLVTVIQVDGCDTTLWTRKYPIQILPLPWTRLSVLGGSKAL